VDLPEPLRPTRQMRSPGATANPAPDSSGAVPKVRLMSWRSSEGGGMADHIACDMRRATSTARPPSTSLQRQHVVFPCAAGETDDIETPVIGPKYAEHPIPMPHVEPVR
jgi:hypothetical protein